MNILDKIQHDKLLQQHVETLRSRYEDEGLSILELQERFRTLAADSSDPTIEDTLRELYKHEYELVNSLIEVATPPPPDPVEVMETLKRTNPAAAEALQHQLGIGVLEDAVAVAQAAMDYAIERKFDPDSYGYKNATVALEAASSALTAALATHPPHFHRLNEASLASQQAQHAREAANSLEGATMLSALEARDQYLQQAQEFEAKASSLRNFDFFAPKGEGVVA